MLNEIPSDALNDTDTTEPHDGAAEVIAALDAAWQDYLTHFATWHTASAAAACAADAAVGQSASPIAGGLWDVEFEPIKVWESLARRLGDYARRKLLPAGMKVEVNDAALQSMGDRRYSRYDSLSEHEAGLRALSLSMVWERYVNAFDPDAARRLAAEQASKVLRNEFWRHVPRRHGRDAEPIGQAGGRYVLTTGIGRDYYVKGYQISYAAGERMHALAQAMSTICALEGEGVMGLSIERGAASAVISLRNGYSSRERVVISGELTLVMFKDHAQWHLTPELWTVLQAGADWENKD